MPRIPDFLATINIHLALYPPPDLWAQGPVDWYPKVSWIHWRMVGRTGGMAVEREWMGATFLNSVTLVKSQQPQAVIPLSVKGA